MLVGDRGTVIHVEFTPGAEQQMVWELLETTKEIFSRYYFSTPPCVWEKSFLYIPHPIRGQFYN